jgi:hypothetical protein
MVDAHSNIGVRREVKHYVVVSDCGVQPGCVQQVALFHAEVRVALSTFEKGLPTSRQVVVNGNPAAQ